MADTRTILINYESNIDEYNKQLEKLDKNSQEYNDTLEKQQKEQKKYDEALIENGKNAQIFGTSLNDVQGALKGTKAAIGLTVKSLGAFKAAFAAAGIGAVITAIGALTVTLERSKRLQDELRRSSASFKAAWGVVAGGITGATEALLGFNKESEKLSFGGRAILFITERLEDLGLVTAGTAAGLEVVLEKAENTEQQFIDMELTISENELAISNLNLALEKNILLSDEQESTGQEFISTVRTTLGIFNELEAAINRRFEAELNVLEAQRQLALGENNTIRATQLQIEINETLIQQKERLAALDGQRSAELVRLADQEVNLAEVVFTLEKQKLAVIETGTAREIEVVTRKNEIIAAQTQKQTAFSISQVFAELQAKLALALGTVFGQTGLGGLVIAPIITALFASLIGRVQSIVTGAIPTFERGGMINGRSHAMGGVHIEAEGGEAIINKRSMAIPGVRQAASYLNELGGGLSFQSGGVVPQINNSSQIIDAINNAANQARIVLVTEDLDAVQNRVSVTEDRSTF